MTSPARRERTPARLARAAALTACVSLAAGAAGCSVFGPRPDPAVLELARATLADARAGGSDLRAHQADQLFDEVERLCGTPLPESCQVERDAAADTTPANWRATADAVDEVPADSAELVAAQAVDAAAADPDAFAAALTAPGADGAADANGGPGGVGKLSEADAEVLRDLLRWEQGLRYGLTTAQAWAGGQTTLIAASDERAAVLAELLAPTGEVPAPAAGYTLTVEPTELPGRAAEETSRHWAKAAAAIGDDPLRELVVSGAAHARSASPTR